MIETSGNALGDGEGQDDSSGKVWEGSRKKSGE